MPVPRADAQTPVSVARSLPPDTEIELKLRIDPGDHPAFEAAPVIAGNAPPRGRRRRLHAVYYDTADQCLRRAGIVLRVRRSGSRFIQTIKTAAVDDPLRRGEWEAAVPSLDPDVTLARPLLPPDLAMRLANEPLLPVFTTDIRRLVRTVALPAGGVEVSFDTGVIVAGAASVPVSEIELELKSGSPQAIYELALRLLEHGPAGPTTRSKAERGFDLADGSAPVAPRPRRPAIDPHATLDDALLAILRGILAHLFAALPAAEDGRGTDGVHQARVALRRLRSLFGLMRALDSSASLDAFRAEASRLADGLGPMRERDVFIGETLPVIEKALPAVEGFAALRRLALAGRAGLQEGVRTLLTDQRASRFFLELGAWVEERGWRADAPATSLAILGQPARDFAERSLASLHAKVLRCGRRFGSMKPARRHDLRIRVKKLRYATDFLAPMLGEDKALQRYYGALAELQDQLGRFNDMATTERIVLGIEDHPAGASMAAGAIVGWQARGLVASESELRAAWRAFRDARPPWRKR